MPQLLNLQHMLLEHQVLGGPLGAVAPPESGGQLTCLAYFAPFAEAAARIPEGGEDAGLVPRGALVPEGAEEENLPELEGDLPQLEEEAPAAEAAEQLSELEVEPLVAEEEEELPDFEEETFSASVPHVFSQEEVAAAFASAAVPSAAVRATRDVTGMGRVLVCSNLHWLADHDHWNGGLWREHPGNQVLLLNFLSAAATLPHWAREGGRGAEGGG